MPRPLPFDQAASVPSPHAPHAGTTSPFNSPPRRTLPSTSSVSSGTAPPSPFYGLEPEIVALHFERQNFDVPTSPSSFVPASRGSSAQLASPNEASMDRSRRYSASSLDPVRPQRRIRTPSPPAVPFDANIEGSTSAWLRWLGERRARRVEAEGGDAGSALQNPNDPLRRLRESAERLRTVESRTGRRIENGYPSTTEATASHEANEAYDESRRLLLEVRQRLEDTRSRIEDARAIVTEADVQEASDSIAQARQGLDRTVAFASRLRQLASTLTDLSERASALASSSGHPPDRGSQFPARSLTTATRSFSGIESPSAANQTDSIRSTVRQLIVASRRVSVAIDRHRAQQAAASSPSQAGPSPLPRSAHPTPALPPVDLPLRVSLPSPLRLSPSSSGTSVLGLGPLGEDLRRPTSTNPDGLLLPSRPLTHSPQGLSTESGENYPGERAQLLRIASLQRDIASRALELRELRARGRELDREERETRRARLDGGQIMPLLAIDADKDEEDEEEHARWLLRRLGRQVEVEANSSGDETVTHSRHKTTEDRKRQYEVYAFCGR